MTSLQPIPPTFDEFKEYLRKLFESTEARDMLLTFYHFWRKELDLEYSREYDKRIKEGLTRRVPRFQPAGLHLLILNQRLPEIEKDIKLLVDIVDNLRYPLPLEGLQVLAKGDFSFDTAEAPTPANEQLKLRVSALANALIAGEFV